jgi:transposase
VLSIDRTEWDRGSKQYNVLCVLASVGKMGALYFEMLNNRSGNSNSEDRIRVLKRIISVLNKDRIDYLVMDREFIGHKWLRWLKQQGIRFCVRVPKHHSILFADDLLHSEDLIHARDVIVDQVIVNLYIGKDKNGELLYLIGNLPVQQLKVAYRKRWSIEVFFRALKGRGFDLEKSGIRCLSKMRKLFAIACIAYSICWATAIEDAKIRAVKRKKTWLSAIQCIPTRSKFDSLSFQIRSR